MAARLKQLCLYRAMRVRIVRFVLITVCFHAHTRAVVIGVARRLTTSSLVIFVV